RESWNSSSPSATVETPLSVLAKFHPIKRLVYIRMRDDFRRRDIYDQDLMAAVTTVQHGREMPGRMHRDVYGEIAQLDLFARRPQGPLIRQQHRAVSLHSGQSSRVRGGGSPGGLARGGSAAGSGEESAD